MNYLNLDSLCWEFESLAENNFEGTAEHRVEQAQDCILEQAKEFLK